MLLKEQAHSTALRECACKSTLLIGRWLSGYVFPEISALRKLVPFCSLLFSAPQVDRLAIVRADGRLELLEIEVTHSIDQQKGFALCLGS